MKAFEFLNECLSEDDLEAVDTLFNSQAGCFSDLVTEAGLDPAYDFRHSDLSGVDFSHADLTGYDLTGADLRDAYGTNVTFPKTAFLQGAEVKGSIFAYIFVVDALADEVSNPYPVTVIDEDDPLVSSDWIITKTHSGNPQRKRAMLAALRHFEVGSNPTILSDTIYSASQYFNEKEKYYAFLVGAIASKKSSSGAVIAALKMLVAAFPRRQYTKKVLLSFFREDGRLEVQLQAVRGLRRITLDLSERADVQVLLLTPELATLRKYLLARLVSSDSHRFGFLVKKRALRGSQPSKGAYSNIFDPASAITAEDLSGFYEHQFIQAQTNTARHQYQSEGVIEVRGKAFQKSILQALFDELQAAHSATGLTFRFAGDVAKALGRRSVP